jgi:hypothetical protein
LFRGKTASSGRQWHCPPASCTRCGHAHHAPELRIVEPHRGSWRLTCSQSHIVRVQYVRQPLRQDRSSFQIEPLHRPVVFIILQNLLMSPSKNCYSHAETPFLLACHPIIPSINGSAARRRETYQRHQSRDGPEMSDPLAAESPATRKDLVRPDRLVAYPRMLMQGRELVTSRVLQHASSGGETASMASTSSVDEAPQPSGVTIVSAYFRISEGRKHPVGDYFEWLKNFLHHVEQPIVFYTSPDLVDTILGLRQGRVSASNLVSMTTQIAEPEPTSPST